jgi:hypothetical protein
MTIKGPNAHNYNDGLSDLLGWEQANRYEYTDDYDVEDHRRYLYEQHMKQQQQYQQQQQHQQYQPEYNSPPQNENEFDMGGNTQEQNDAAAAEAVRKKLWWEK